jgi:pyruvate formate lyase activating enzyme
MLIGGIQTLTLLDFPGKVATTIFTVGCNFRCGYCHNPELVLPELIKKNRTDLIPEEKFFNFLKSRENFLDGVAITGGEPTLQPDLVEFIAKIKARGLLVKLDTNGTNPEMLKELISPAERGKSPLVDYYAMDIKYPLKKYSKIVGIGRDLSALLKKSIDLIRNSGADYEFRTTVIAEYHTPEIIEKIARIVSGCRRYTLQNFRPDYTLDKKFAGFHGLTVEKLAELKKIAEKYIEEVKVIG